jgi:hypothetical protein
MNWFDKFRRRFFAEVEATPVAEPAPEELVDGKAFTIKHYSTMCTHYLVPNDVLRATISEDGEVLEQVEETINRSMTVDTISTLRFNDALGYKHAIGVLFGERKK